MTFHETTSGARDDLRRATEIARMMVTEYGMSEQLGLVTFESNYRSPFLDGYPSAEGAYSDTTAYQIDQEVKHIIDETNLRVRNILEQHVGMLEELAQVLLEKETIEREEFDQIIGKNPLKSI